MFEMSFGRFGRVVCGMCVVRMGQVRVMCRHLVFPCLVVFRGFLVMVRHPAELNFGDCFSYALAKVSGEPVLFKGSDFRKTDIPAALP